MLQLVDLLTVPEHTLAFALLMWVSINESCPEQSQNKIKTKQYKNNKKLLCLKQNLIFWNIVWLSVMAQPTFLILVGLALHSSVITSALPSGYGIGDSFSNSASEVKSNSFNVKEQSHNEDALSLVMFDDVTASKYAAKCLDGSPAGFYLRNSSTNSTEWVIYLKGGGLCVEPLDCLERVSPVLSEVTHCILIRYLLRLVFELLN